MACLVDTCGWIEWLTADLLADDFEPYLEDPAELVIQTTLQFELYKWAKREKGEVQALEVVGLTEQGQVVPLNTQLSLYAADMALQYRLSFADAIIYATAIQNGVKLITADDHFQGLPEVIYFSKKTASK
jgi:predicted nucleic acid-binding protein